MALHIAADESEKKVPVRLWSVYSSEDEVHFLKCHPSEDHLYFFLTWSCLMRKVPFDEAWKLYCIWESCILIHSVERYFKHSFFHSSAQWRRLLFQHQLYSVTLMQHSMSRIDRTSFDI